MAFDPSKYIYQPRPLQQYDFGQGFRDVIEARQGKRRMDQQESQYNTTRSDTQATNAATYARDTANTQYDTQKKRYDEQASAIARARAAAQSGHLDAARALIPGILGLGGQASEDSPGNFYFKEGDAPTRGAPDVNAARQQIYQGAPPGTAPGQPFQVPGFGDDGQRNPFAPPALPGASAAALPQPPPGAGAPPQTPAMPGAIQGPPPGAPPPGAPPPGAPPVDAAGPPPGPARSVAPPGSVWLPPGMDPSMAAGAAPTSSPPTPPAGAPPPGDSPQAEQPGSPQATGPNPFETPAFSPYAIDSNKIRDQNKERLDPFLGGVANAAGSRYKGRIDEINKYVSSLGLPPDESIKVTEKLYGEVFALARAELAGEGQSGRMAMAGRHQDAIQYDRDRDRGFRIAAKLTTIDGLAGAKKKMETSRGVEDLLKVAHRNGAAANALIRQVYKMYADGVMTDKDYVDTKEGVQTLFQSVVNKSIEKVFNPNGGGLAPNVIKDMKELIRLGTRSHQRALKEASSSLYRAWKSNRNEAERDAIEETMRSVVSDEYLPPEFTAQGQDDASSNEVEDEQAVMQRMAAQEGGVVDNVGVVPLPKKRAGEPDMPPERPRAPGAVRGSKVPEKPLRKTPTTPEERKQLMEEMRKAAEEYEASQKSGK